MCGLLSRDRKPHEVAQDVTVADARWHASDLVGRDTDGDVGELRGSAAVFDQGDYYGSQFECSAQSCADLVTAAKGADAAADEVAGLAECPDVAAEDTFDAGEIVVADSSEDGDSGGDGVYGAALALKAADEFCCEVVCVCGATSIPAPDDLITAEHYLDHLRTGLSVCNA